MQLNTQIAIMTRVIIAPASNADSRRHFVDTIENPVNIAEYKDFFGSEYETLDRLPIMEKLHFGESLQVKMHQMRANIVNFQLAIWFFSREITKFFTPQRFHTYLEMKNSQNRYGALRTLIKPGKICSLLQKLNRKISLMQH